MTETKEIREIRTYANNEGCKLTAFYKIDTATMQIDYKDVGFTGTVGIMTSRGPVQFEFEFPDGYTIEQCFSEFHDLAEKSVEEKVKQMQEQQRIVTPSQAKNSGNIIIP